jgi:hypothetical protein
VYLRSSDETETIKYEFIYSPFKIVQYVNDKVTIVINDLNDLRYASLDAPHNTYMYENDQLIEGYEIGIGVTINAQHVFGLPQRASDTFELQTNTAYRLFN